MAPDTPRSPLATARSLLFLPATRLERLARALQSGADLVVCDLEDAVPPDQKDAARSDLVHHLQMLPGPDRARCLVRINAAATPWHPADLDALAPLCDSGLGGVMVPKAEQAEALARVAQRLGPRAMLVALVESLAGWDAVAQLARAAQVGRLAFGHLDFQLDLGMRCEPGERELDAVRLAIVAAARRAGLPPPIDGVTTAFADDARLQADAARARGFGFGAKLCIHPAQIAAVHAAFTPSDEEVRWARRVVAEATDRGGAAFSLEGRMVDLPVVRAAEAVMQRARE